jgi:hypothetical protein
MRNAFELLRVPTLSLPLNLHHIHSQEMKSSQLVNIVIPAELPRCQLAHIVIPANAACCQLLTVVLAEESRNYQLFRLVIPRVLISSASSLRMQKPT